MDAEHLLAAEESLFEAQSVLKVFERAEPDDDRPRKALDALKLWMRGELEVGKVRDAAFAAHAAARETTSESAKFAARACGQAASVAHVMTHSWHVKRYADKARESAGIL
ncbi:MAG: hypothetical protein RL716_795 [Actinomycetota bacterium]|jgi:hypothetical protein|uniref:putative immunity protein n=1 Tax=Rhodoluna sp. TaxID=1969481 RepID=UPI0025E0A8E6|nr:hypothetical protein [Rhodoluna sp.]